MRVCEREKERDYNCEIRYVAAKHAHPAVANCVNNQSNYVMVTRLLKETNRVFYHNGDHIFNIFGKIEKNRLLKCSNYIHAWYFRILKVETSS